MPDCDVEENFVTIGGVRFFADPEDSAKRQYLADLAEAYPENGFEIKGDYLALWWGGFEYSIRLSDIESPEDCLWWISHIGTKDWQGQTPQNLALMVRAISEEKGWSVHRKLPHPNEAPEAEIRKAAERAKMTPKLRYDVIARDGHRCRCCGLSVSHGAILHVDHIQPVSKGGRTEVENLQTLCSACNLGKGTS